MAGCQQEPCCASFVRMFKPRFAAMVERGEKLQTVRPVPKRMPKPGDKISLRAWTEKPYRSKHRVLRDAVITSVYRITIEDPMRTRETWGLKKDGICMSLEACKEFAKADGFTTMHEMLQWFHTTHGLPFEGIAIHWHNR